MVLIKMYNIFGNEWRHLNKEPPAEEWNLDQSDIIIWVETGSERMLEVRLQRYVWERYQKVVWKGML